MRFRVLVLLLMFLCGILLGRLDVMKLPSIELPQFVQHQTFGELPIVEMADDGVFAEKDGDEYTVTSQWCDEQKVMFTCSLKFGQSYSVARRIATGEFFKSCEEARKQSQEDLNFCIKQEDEIRRLPDSVNFYTDYYKDGVERCIKNQSYIPECDGEYEWWIKEKEK